MRKNDIARVQNEKLALTQIAAFGSYYAQVQMIRLLEVLFVVGVPIGLAVTATFNHAWDLMAAFVGMTIVFMDAAIFYPAQNTARTNGAQVQEIFECAVLQLPTSPTRMSNAPDVDEVQGAANSRIRLDGGASGRDWYPTQFSDLPIALARLACMRASCTYDVGLRSIYISLLVGSALIGFGILTLTALHLSASLEQFIISFAYPVTPAVVWVIREVVDQLRSKSSRLDLRNAICALWSDALGLRRSPADIASATIDFHAALSYHRRECSGVPSFIYRFARKQFEERMRTGADVFVAQARNSEYMNRVADQTE